ncbi:MAG TPA: ABC transporter ATP-binding protein [Candidatus Saccharimonadales bacterium]|nr:ABC transporter ATP-binding protein [Candidatus Saccharimonadales bacterium]
MKTGIATSSTDRAVDNVLRHFGGDVDAAVEAIRAASLRSSTNKQHPAPKTPVLIEATDVTKTYRMGHQTVQALKGASLEIHEGEFVAITGASGSGKSTLLQLLGGLDKPSSGSITVAGREIGRMHDRELSRFRGQMVGFVFQFFYLQPFLSIRRNLEVPGMFSRLKPAERLERLTEIAEKVGLTDRLDHLPAELSGGQMQRAAIARALLNKPRLLLADEPTGNLDSKNGAAIIQLFEAIRREFGTTVVLVTHDQAAARQAERIIALKDGAIV